MATQYMDAKCLLVLILCYGANNCFSQCTYPLIHFEAFSSQGIRISFPIDSHIQVYNFRFRSSNNLTNKSEWITFEINIPKGSISPLVSKHVVSGRWVYLNSDIKLNIGDYLWYRLTLKTTSIPNCAQEYLIWRVKDLGNINDTLPNSDDCISSITTVNGKSTCRYTILFEDNFNSKKLNLDKWISEQYIPLNGPNYEFNYYSHDAIHVDHSTLHITPTPKQSTEEVRGTLDLSLGCTSSDVTECTYTQQGAQYLPPIKSGKIKSKFSFKYGQIVIVAKLPGGDWLYPEITLSPTDAKDLSKIYIVYTRGNKRLEINGSDFGSTRLYSGYSKSPMGLEESLLLSSTKVETSITGKFFIYTIIWTPDEIISYIGGKHYGRNPHYMTSECNICLGVAVGGINGFPDDCLSRGHGSYMYAKPWKNKDVRQVKNFFVAKNLWLPSWSNAIGKKLIVSSVRIYAL